MTQLQPIDVVIPLGRGSRHGDAELRYCLRSIAKHLDGLGRVWIVGERPHWLVVDGENLIHLPVPDVCPIADVAMFHKIGAACIETPGRPRLADRFVHFCDDVLLLRPVGWPQLGPYHKGDLVDRTDWPAGWWQRVRHTRDYLAARSKTTLNGDGHLPVPMLRDEFLRVLRETDWRKPPGLCVGPLYLNWTGARMRPLGERYASINDPLPAQEIRRRVAGRWFLCHGPRGFTPELRGLLDELFPEPCRWEREAAIRVKPAGPTLSVIIPTIGRTTLRRTLDSIRGQRLVEGDEVVLVQDGPAEEAARRVFEESGLPGKYLSLDRRYADFGGTPRNHGMAHARADYLAFMDDDDVYTPGAFNAIRAAAVRHPGRPMMFRMALAPPAGMIWRDQTLRVGNVSTDMIVVPNQPDRLAPWPSYSCGDLGFVAHTLGFWPDGSLRWEPATIAAASSAGTPPPDDRPTTRNLIYHVYPRADNLEWRSNVGALVRSWDLFNGRKLVGVAMDDTTDPLHEVEDAFPSDPRIEWLLAPNDPSRGEALTFAPAAEALRSYSLDEATFFAHAKGVVSPNVARAEPARRPIVLENIRRWRDWMYRGCLEQDRDELDRVLHRYAMAGCFRVRRGFKYKAGRVPSPWFFSGTFFWYNHARFYPSPYALTLDFDRWAVERHPGQVLPIEESHCFLGDGCDGAMYNWSSTQWDMLERTWPHRD